MSNEHINIKYIKTKINGEPKILCMVTCNLCPMLKFNAASRTAFCSKYFCALDVIGLSHNIISNNIWGYSCYQGVSSPYRDLQIPTWCGLQSHLPIVNTSNQLYTRTGHNTYSTEINESTNLAVFSSQYIKYDNVLTNLITNRVTNLPMVYNDGSRLLLDDFGSSEKCSCCGKLSKDVKRTEHIGMCDNCWDKNDKNIEYFSYINNFRLKRKSTWIKKIDKKIDKELIKIKN